MKSKALLVWLSIILTISILSPLQAYQLTDQQFQESLKSYVDKLLIRFGEENIEKERFLVQQLRMLNEELRTRVGDVTAKRQTYFDKLQTRLNEIKTIKNRLPSSAGSQIFNFIDDLSQRIQNTIDAGIVDYKRQKVFDDATQLLYLAEELIKMDPNVNLSANPQISEGLSKLEKKSTSAFGHKGRTATGNKKRMVKSNPGVFDIYKEWQRTQRIKYLVRLTDVEVLKKKLIKKSSISELERMFKRELRNAAQAYNFGYYEFAGLSFSEILKRYKDVGQLDDVLFYKGQCDFLLGRYNAAKESFDKLINDYASSAYSGQAYTNLITIASHYENYIDAVNYFREMQNVVSTTDQFYQEALLKAINAAYNGSLYEEAVNMAFEVEPNSPVYNYARYIQAEAQAGARNFEDALATFGSILNDRSLEPDFRFDILAKMGFIRYEMGQPREAIALFNQVGGNYSRYDRVLMGYGWSYYKMEIEKVLVQSRNFSQAKKYLEVVIDDYPNSEYYLEAKTLLGYINQLELDTNGALENFRYAYNAKNIKDLSDNLNVEQAELESIVKTAKRLEKKALLKNNPVAYSRAQQMLQTVTDPLNKLKYQDLSPVSAAANNERSRLQKQLAELDRLKVKAEEKGNKVALDKIDDLKLKIYRALNDMPVFESSPLGFNYFDEHPLARKESVVEHENAKVDKMRQDARKEREKVIREINKLEMAIRNARARRDYRKVANLSVSKDRFQDLLKKMDYIQTWTYSLKKRKTNINLSRWSDYGAFGLANVNFAVRNLQKQQIGQIRDQIQKINDLLIQRKENIEHTINRIKDEITLMTRRVRRQERIRKREELYRQFEESYFDTHESETENPNNTTVPPSFDDEDNQDNNQ
ncbi:MAG: hypothetical protein D6677_11155 [Calditrichaeota bacterium]|nr:MAG: hypothetical protein D6677_11155 [Calditrichota bacterium]